MSRIAGGVGLAGGGFAAMIGNSLKAADALNDLRLRSGLSTEFLSSMKQGLDLAGSSVEALAGGFRRLQKNATLAAEGNKKALQLFSDLRIDFQKFKDLKPDDQVRAFAEAISKIADPALRNTLLIRGMGGAAATLAPAFADGAAGLAAMEAQARATGQVISTEMGVNADRALDSIKLMSDAFSGLGKQAALEFAGPIADSLESITKKLIEWAPHIKGFFAATLNNIAGLVAGGIAIAHGNFAGAMEIDKTLKADNAAAYARASGTGDAAVQKQQLEEQKKISKGIADLSGSFKYGVPATAQ